MSERILLVEDDPVFRSVIEDNLVCEGYSVDAVGDGNAAPTDLEELLARIRAVLRRARVVPQRLKVGRLVIDFRTQQATSGAKMVRLSHHEFKLLQYMAERRDQVVPREELLAEVWGYVDPKATTRSVDQTIFRLRQKIEPDPHSPVYIRTAHRDGYCLTSADEPSAHPKR